MKIRKRLLLFAMLGFLALAQTAQARVILWEDFSTTSNGTLPIGWSVVDNIGDNPRWTTDNYCLWESNGEDWDLIAYPFAAADNVCSPRYYPESDTDLISNEIDLSLFTDVEITFDADCARYVPDVAAILDPDISFELYDGTNWTAVSGFDPVDTIWGNDASYPFDISTLADGNGDFAIRWRFAALETEDDVQYGWCAVDNILIEGECPDTTTETLMVDDGTNETMTMLYGYDSIDVTCIEPTVYPSYLTEISAFFVDPPNVAAGTTPVKFAVFRGTLVDGPEAKPIWVGDEFTPSPGTSGAWSIEDISDEEELEAPLTAGAWCLGVLAPDEFGNQAVGVDASDSGNSWKGSWDEDLWYWSDYAEYPIDGNAMIRGEAEYCVEATTTTTTTTTTVPTSTTTTTQPPADDDTDDDMDDDMGDDDADDDDDDDGAATVSPPEEDGLGGGSFDFGCN
ncbi:MAG: hypothetical protein IT350_06640 [Deltaproteobacteria bacterium]|nr:hypothetical protein [Deltaproteobacteria bacterium]